MSDTKRWKFVVGKFELFDENNDIISYILGYDITLGESANWDDLVAHELLDTLFDIILMLDTEGHHYDIDTEKEKAYVRVAKDFLNDAAIERLDVVYENILSYRGEKPEPRTL